MIMGYNFNKVIDNLEFIIDGKFLGYLLLN